MRIKMQGFIVFDFAKEYPEARKELARWLEEGKIKRKETIVKGGLKAAEEALVGLYNGINTGEFLATRGLHVSIPHAVVANRNLGKLIVEIQNPNDASKL